MQGKYAAVSGLKGESAIYSLDEGKVEQNISVDEPVTDTLWTGSKVIFATSQGSLKVFEDGNQVAHVSEHAGAATALSVHPGGKIVASVGSDKSVVLYEVESMKRVSRAYADSGMFPPFFFFLFFTHMILTFTALTTSAFHPDGHILAAGTTTGKIKLYLTKTLTQAAEFNLGAPIQALTFSENGFWLAATAKGQTTVTIFDLRKEGDAATAKVLDAGGAVQGLSWDFSGQFLAAVGGSGVVVFGYVKGSKAWSEPFRSSVGGVGVRWGEGGQRLVSLNGEGVVTVFSGEM